MKSLFASLALLVLAGVSTASAWSGGPWSNGGVLPTGANGRYQAVISGKNMIGILEFSYTNAPAADNVITAGSALVFYEGFTYRSTNGAFVDEGSRSVTGIIVEDNGAVGSFGDMHGYYTAKITSTGAAYTFNGEGEMLFFVGTEPQDPAVPDGPTVDVYERAPFDIRGSRTSITMVAQTESAT